MWTQVGMPISLSKRIGPDSFSVVWGSLHLLHNEPVTFPALPVPIYTPGWRGVIMVKCLTQGHNTLIATGLEPTTFCLWIQHWSARPHASTNLFIKIIHNYTCTRMGTHHQVIALRRRKKHINFYLGPACNYRLSAPRVTIFLKFFNALQYRTILSFSEIVFGWTFSVYIEQLRYGYANSATTILS